MDICIYVDIERDRERERPEVHADKGAFALAVQQPFHQVLPCLVPQLILPQIQRPGFIRVEGLGIQGDWGAGEGLRCRVWGVGSGV